MSVHIDIHLQIILVGLITISGCNTTPTDTDSRQAAPVMRTDSFHESTGNILLDSLLRSVETAKQDTNLVKLYYEVGKFYADIDHIKAKEYYSELKTLSEKLKWRPGQYLFARGYTEILNREGLIDSSIVIHQQTLVMAKEETDELQVAMILGNIGNCYNYKNWFETALKYYNEALPIFENQGETIKLAHLYNLMAMVYYDMNMPDENLIYSEKALDMLHENPDTLIRAHTLINYSLGLLTSGQLEMAENRLLEAQRIFSLHNSKYNLIKVYNNLGSLALRKFDRVKAETYLLKASEIALEFGDVEGFCISGRGIGLIEMYRGNFDNAEKYLMAALEAAVEHDFSVQEMKCYGQLSDIATARNDFPGSRIYATKSDSINHTLMSASALRAVKEMEVRYETEKKESHIAVLEKEKQLMTWIGITGGGVLLLGLITLVFLWRWTIQKKRIAEQQKQLAEQQVRQLEQEKQLVATQAVINGEVQERSRLARDLHDGLGGKLTCMKLNLQELNQNAGFDDEKTGQFNAIMGILDDTVREMRRVSHNLMPDALSRSGLKTAVDDFCRSMSTKIVFNWYGDEARLDIKLEALIYRCIHELVNNALKYADASQIMVQIIREAGTIAFTVQDDGCGFDAMVEAEGMGLQNIRNRVASLGGEIHIDSTVSEGTEENVELKIEN